MSQHGAQGAALVGLTHQRILRFYYRGTRLSQARGPLRVLVTADTSADLQVADQAGLRLRDLGARTTYAVPRDRRATRWRLTTDGRNRDVVQYLAGGTWRRWSPGGARVLRGRGEFFADGPVRLVTPSGARAYRGRLRAVMPAAGSSDRDTVNVLGLDAYVQGVVAAEMPALWEPEAVQAQTVAARSYAVWHRSRSDERHYDICDTTACQVYGGRSAEHPASNAAVRATAGQVLTYRGAPVFTEFSSSSGGWTVASDLPYQVARQDPYDDWRGNAYHNWSAPLAAATVEGAYPSLGRLRGIRVTARDGHGEWQGRILRMVLDGRRRDVTISGDEFRSRFGLRSTWLRP
jgi:SpoIID/LytB domain protein